MPDKPHGETPGAFYGNGKKYRVLWLLHGTFGDHTDWVRKSMIELYASELELIVVMPSALNSNYLNWPEFGTGYNMEDYLIEELMPFVYGWLPASDKKEDNFISGLSMGGGGALRYILNYPEKFAAGAILSAPPMDLSDTDWEGKNPDDRWGMASPRFRNGVENAGGKEAYIEKEDTLGKIIKTHSEGTLPKLMFACGERDGFYPKYLAFKELSEKERMGCAFYEYPGLAHEWRFWDLSIQEALKFFKIKPDVPETEGGL